MDKHKPARGVARKPLALAAIVTLTILVFELVGGILANSLALLSDAAHMFSDLLAVLLSLAALTIAMRPADHKRTYGYHRAEIIATLINGLFLLFIASKIFVEAYQRLTSPQQIQSALMLKVAIVGLIANLISLKLLHNHTHSMNIKSAFYHILGDTISSVGVIIGAIVIAVTGWYQIDAILSFAIGIIIIYGALMLVKESVDVLLESVPNHICAKEVGDRLVDLAEIKAVHDLHIWCITTNFYALSAHIVVDNMELDKAGDIIKNIEAVVRDEYSIMHTTIQIESHDDCEMK